MAFTSFVVDEMNAMQKIASFSPYLMVWEYISKYKMQSIMILESTINAEKLLKNSN